MPALMSGGGRRSRSGLLLLWLGGAARAGAGNSVKKRSTALTCN